MYNLQLSPEQLEMRDTVRDFVTREIKPVALKAERLDVCDRSLLTDLLDQASQVGLRSLALSEERGGAGADALTSCIVTEEVAVGDADIAVVLSESSRLAHLLFDQVLSDAQRDAFLPKFLDSDRYHLAFAGHEAGAETRLGVNYHRPASSEVAVKTAAVKASNGEWIVNGVKDCVANAPIAGLFAVLVQIPGRPAASVLLVPADALGVSVCAHDNAWQHGACGQVTFKECRVPAGNLLGDDAAALLTGGATPGRGIPMLQALNLGIGRAAYEAAFDYAQLRVQGGRPLIEHQAIGTKLAEDRDPARGCARRRLAGGLGIRSSRGDRRPQPARPAATDNCARVHVRGGDESGQGRSGNIRRHGRNARHAAAEIHPRRPRLPAFRRRQYRRQAAYRGRAGRLPARRQWRDGAGRRITETFQVRMLPWISL